MKPLVTLQVKGTEQFIRKLQSLTASLRGEILRTALTAGALEIVNEAKTKAPIKTGTLMRSIHIGGHTDMTDFQADEGYSDISGEEITAETVTICIGTNLIYARIQEFGGTIEAKNAPFLVFRVEGYLVKTKRVTIPAHPYMRPAYDTKKQDAIDVFKDELLGQIRRAVA